MQWIQHAKGVYQYELISVQLEIRIKELLPQELMESLGCIQQAYLDTRSC